MTRIALYKLNGGKWHSQPGFGTVNMRPFQKGLHTKVLKWAWHRGTHLAYHPLLWSQQRLMSLHAPHIPDDLNRVAVSLSLQVTLGPGLLEHEFPPVSIIAWTLCKVREDMEQLLFVPHHWPNKNWFSELALLASAPPWWIPLWRDLLSQGKSTICHQQSDLGNLHVWSLDATRRNSEVFHLQW